MLLIICLVFAAILALERCLPGWELPPVRHWSRRAWLSNALQLILIVLTGCFWEQLPHGIALMPLMAEWPSAFSGVTAYVIASFMFYWWHRWRHESAWLWRTLHQLHHSPRRLEACTAFFKHPAEMLINAMLGSALIYGVLGLSAEAGGIYALCAATVDLFYHANLRTPQWLGYFVQRPEMHRIHHQSGYHRNNYGDLPCWDLLFGTFENPERWEGNCGFDAEREARCLAMLAGHDVHSARASAPGMILEPFVHHQPIHHDQSTKGGKTQ